MRHNAFSVLFYGPQCSRQQAEVVAFFENMPYNVIEIPVLFHFTTNIVAIMLKEPAWKKEIFYCKSSICTTGWG